MTVSLAKMFRADGPYPLGKFSTLRDEYLHGMCVEGWANESTGDVSAPTGYVWLLSNSPAEMPEIIGAFGPAPLGTVGHFLVIEDDMGFVHVNEYDENRGAKYDFRALEAQYAAWDDEDTDEDAEPRAEAAYWAALDREQYDS